MFKRILVEDWVQFVPIISFSIFAAVFLVVSIRALRLRKPERERMAAMPLDVEKPADSTHLNSSL